MEFYNKDRKNALHMIIGKDYDDILSGFGEFVEKEIAPAAQEIDEKKMFPKENIRKLAAMGFTTMPFSAKYGGLELPYEVYTGCLEMLGEGCASTALTVAIHGTVCGGINDFCNDSQKNKHLPELLSLEKLCAFGLTEPQGGSNAAGLKTTAVPQGNDYVLNGNKMFITNVEEASLYFIMAKVPNKGISSFLVEKDTKGFEVAQLLDKMGVRGSKTGELIFDNCTIPKENLIGDEGKGLKYALSMLSGGRITIAALSVGIAQAAYKKTLAYVNEREQFGQKIGEFQLVKAKIADVATEIQAARLLTYYAAHLKEKKEDIRKVAAQAKLKASEVAMKACQEAIQLHGGVGYITETGVERLLRDAQLCTIGEGTSEILRVKVIADLCYKEL